MFYELTQQILSQFKIQSQTNHPSKSQTSRTPTTPDPSEINTFIQQIMDTSNTKKDNAHKSYGKSASIAYKHIETATDFQIKITPATHIELKNLQISLQGAYIYITESNQVTHMIIPLHRSIKSYEMQVELHPLIVVQF